MKTTVRVSRKASIGNKRFYGGTQVVSLEEAQELVKQGVAKIVDPDTKDEIKAAIESEDAANTKPKK